MSTHSLEASDPDYRRGETAARIAVRDCPDPRSLAQLRRFAASQLEQAELATAQADIQLRHARGYRDHLSALADERQQQETT